MLGVKVKYYQIGEKIVRVKTNDTGEKHAEEWDPEHKYFVQSVTYRPFDVEVRGRELRTDEILTLGIT